MKLEKLLRTQISKVQALSNKLNFLNEEMTKRPMDEFRILQEFNDLFNQYQANPVLLKTFATFLRMVQSEELDKQIMLEDIETLYSALAELNPSDIDQELEHFYYLDWIMAEQEKAKKVIKNIEEQIKIFNDREQI
ncbi:MAG: hypothetical protein R2767_07485 [Chitinophagales bacterium]|nr:hypothetical protein [Chitinophagales bacterium]